MTLEQQAQKIARHGNDCPALGGDDCTCGSEAAIVALVQEQTKAARVDILDEIMANIKTWGFGTDMRAEEIVDSLEEMRLAQLT